MTSARRQISIRLGSSHLTYMERRTPSSWWAIYGDVFLCVATCEACRYRFRCYTGHTLVLDFEEALLLYMRVHDSYDMETASNSLRKITVQSDIIDSFLRSSS